MDNSGSKSPLAVVRSRGYIVYLTVFMTIVALIDTYISTIKTTALPYILKEYNMTPAQFSWNESLFFIITFLVFLLNGLNDIIGRKWSILILLVLMGASCICIVYFTPNYLMFMIFYAIAVLTTVSNMWSISISEESKAAGRGKAVAIVYTLGLLPFAAILPPILVNTLGLSWKWMYGVMFFFMLVGLVLWFFMKETYRYQQIQEERKAGTRKKHLFGIGVINRSDIKYIIICSIMWICWLLAQLLFFWAGYFFMDLRGYSLQQWSTILLLALIGMVIGGFVGGWSLDKIGRKLTFVIGCLGTVLCLTPVGFVPVKVSEILIIATGFFISVSYSWIVVYVPEIFPTERRGSCMGWTTTITRSSYVLGPALAAILLTVSPKMEWFWVVTGLIMLVPAAILLIIRPYETKSQTLEEIEKRT